MKPADMDEAAEAYLALACEQIMESHGDLTPREGIKVGAALALDTLLRAHGRMIYGDPSAPMDRVITTSIILEQGSLMATLIGRCLLAFMPPSQRTQFLEQIDDAALRVALKRG